MLEIPAFPCLRGHASITEHDPKVVLGGILCDFQVICVVGPKTQTSFWIHFPRFSNRLRQFFLASGVFERIGANRFRQFTPRVGHRQYCRSNHFV